MVIFVSAEHPSNVDAPIVDTLLPKSISPRELQFKNDLELRVVRLAGSLTLVRPVQPSNVLSEMRTIESGKENSLRRTQPLKQPTPISLTLSGIVIDSFVYLAIGGWHFLREGENQGSGAETFEEYLLKKYNDISGYGYVVPALRAPGSLMKVEASKSWETLGKVLRYMA